MGSSYVALVGAELTETYLPQPPECTTMPCLFILFVSYLILFSEIVSLYISGWPCTFHPLSSTSGVLGL